MKPVHDLFVGFVAIGLGCLLVFGAIFQSPLLMRLGKSRLLAEAIGSLAARWLIAAIGLACVAMGALVVSGWRIRW